MGCFSWLDCKDKKQIHIGDSCFLLVPDEFTREYGEKIFSSRYDGYGHIGGYDVYELSAIFNRKYINESNLEDEPKEERYSTKENYKRAVKWYKYSVNRLYDFRDGKLSDEEMEAKYGEDWLREIGIDISCYDRQQERLLYPLKITHDNAIRYEDCANFSLSDENQGCD